LRVVVIGGRARHTVARASRSPITNLRIGGSRVEVESVHSRMSADGWSAALESCEKIAAAFPGALHLGVDLLIRSDFHRHAIAEVNAFGDLLPGLTLDGIDTYETELLHLLNETPR
jgi:hypothetical protein